MEKRELDLASYIIATTFLQNIHSVIVFENPVYQATWPTHKHHFFTFLQRQIYCFFANQFFITVSSRGRYGL